MPQRDEGQGLKIVKGLLPDLPPHRKDSDNIMTASEWQPPHANKEPESAQLTGKSSALVTACPVVVRIAIHQQAP